MGSGILGPWCTDPRAWSDGLARGPKRGINNRARRDGSGGLARGPVAWSTSARWPGAMAWRDGLVRIGSDILAHGHRTRDRPHKFHGSSARRRAPKLTGRHGRTSTRRTRRTSTRRTRRTRQKKSPLKGGERFYFRRRNQASGILRQPPEQRRSRLKPSFKAARAHSELNSARRSVEPTSEGA